MTHGMDPDVAVIGGGAWGTALAQMLASDGRDVMLWVRENEVYLDITTNRRNTAFLPGVEIAPTIRPTGRITDVATVSTVLVVTPAQHMRSVLETLHKPPRDLVLCSKGIEQGTGRLMNDVAAEVCPESEIAILSGPTFAHEVASGLPTAVTLACSSPQQWERVSPIIARPAFRPYYSDDVTGAEIGGSIKNVLAIACGVVEGLGLGQNARASVIARGYAEMLRFGEALGAQSETLPGLCGLGDLVLTCSSTSSRNFSLGMALGKGGIAADLMADRTTVAEGAHTAPVLASLAQERQITMPIVTAVNTILEGADPRDVVAEMLARPLTAEMIGDQADID